MARKKKTKETVNKTVKETVIKNADEMFEDIKKLASEDENVVNTIVEGISEETNSIKEANIETDTIEGNTKTEDSDEEVNEEVREKIKEFIEDDNNETMTPEEVFDKLSKDFGNNSDIDKCVAKDFVIKQEKVQAETNSETTDNIAEEKSETTEETKKKKSNKKHRMTYEEMFGYTWMGYGYTE